MPGTAVGRCICGRVCAYTQSGPCARQVGQENALLIVFEVCKANQGTSLISHRRRVACNLPQIQLCAHTPLGGKSCKFLLNHFSFYLLSLPFLFLFKGYCPRNNCFAICLTLSLGKKEKRREAISHYDSSGNCRTIENEQGNLLPINCIFIWYSYHPNLIFMQNDAACVGTGSIIAKHARVRYANGAYFPSNLKWLSLYHIHTMP